MSERTHIRPLFGAGLLLSALTLVPVLEGRGPSLHEMPVMPLSTLRPVVSAPAEPVAAPVATTEPMSVPVVASIEPLPTRDERQVRVLNVNTRERATFFVGPRGYVRAEQVAAVNHFFRCRRTERERAIDPGVLSVLADISARWPGRVIEVISGFRAPPFGVPHSRHFKGHAIDLRVRGVRTAVVRDWVWREHHGVGVGFYAEGDFVHVDTRNDEDEIAWSAREESSRPEYNPRWSKRARRGKSRPTVVAGL